MNYNTLNIFTGFLLLIVKLKFDRDFCECSICQDGSLDTICNSCTNGKCVCNGTSVRSGLSCSANNDVTLI
jgi:hypothetical protein